MHVNDKLRECCSAAVAHAQEPCIWADSDLQGLTHRDVQDQGNKRTCQAWETNIAVPCDGRRTCHNPLSRKPSRMAVWMHAFVDLPKPNVCKIVRVV